MPGVPCNKCRSGWQQTGDSWCLGCSSLEVAQQGFRRVWQQPGIRAVAEEAALNCARYIRALGNLDSTLGSGSAGSQGLSATAKSGPVRPRSRSPVRDERPPLRRSAPSREPPQRPREHREREGGDRGYERHRDRERDRDRDRDRDRRRREKAEEPSEEELEEESEEEEPKQRDSEVKVEEKRDRSRDRRQPPPEPENPPSWKRTDKSTKKKKKKKRGGARHQRHGREVLDPLRSSHRRLPAEKLELARSLESGLERRA
eukprot:s3254_g12.t1